MDTAGKAVLFSGLTVLVSLSAVMLVPSPAFRSMALGIMLSVVFVLAATLTLLPAVLAKLGPKVDAMPLRWVHSGEHRSARFARWGERLWRHPHVYGPAATLVLVLLALPIVGLKTGDAVDQGRPERATARASATRRCSRRSGPARRARCRSSRPRARRAAVAAVARRDAGIARVLAGSAPAATASRSCRRSRPPTRRARRSGARSTGSARALPAGALVGGAAAENHDLEAALAAKTPLVIGVVLALGFLLLLVALQAPLIAALGVLDEPARDRRRLRHRPADLPERPRRRAARLRVAGLHGRLGAGVLLRDDLRDLDGLHGVPALVGQGALGPLRTTRAKRWSAGSRTRAA